jgi:hypothetical protein
MRRCDKIEEDYNIQAVRSAYGSYNQIAEAMV